MSDKTTALIERDRLSDLVLATTQPEVSAHTIPRVLVTQRDATRAFEHEVSDESGSVSPLAVLIVIGLLLAVFVAIVQI